MTKLFAALIRTTLAMLLATIGLLAVGVGPATAGISAVLDDADWTVATAANDFGSGRQNYTYSLNPGGQLDDALVVANHGPTPLDLAVYAADGFTTDGGQLDLRTTGAKSTAVGAWTHPDRSTVTVQPGQSINVPFTLSLPNNATPGDYLGGIVTSQVGQADGRSVERRVGLRIRLRVGGPLRPSLSVENLRVEYSGTANPFGTGDATVTYTIRNNGNAIVAARQAVSISGPMLAFQVGADAMDDTPQLLPGDTWKIAVPVHGVTPALSLTGTVALTPLLTDASGSIAPLAAVETTTHAAAVPWTLLLLVLALGAGLFFGMRYAVRRRPTSGKEVSVRPRASATAPSKSRTLR